MSRVFRLAADHYLVTEPGYCPHCENAFQAGDEIVLSPLPPRDPENRAKMEAGRVYTTEALPVHVECLRRESAASDRIH